MLRQLLEEIFENKKTMIKFFEGKEYGVTTIKYYCTENNYFYEITENPITKESDVVEIQIGSMDYNTYVDIYNSTNGIQNKIQRRL